MNSKDRKSTQATAEKLDVLCWVSSPENITMGYHSSLFIIHLELPHPVVSGASGKDCVIPRRTHTLSFWGKQRLERGLLLLIGHMYLVAKVSLEPPVWGAVVDKLKNLFRR